MGGPPADRSLPAPLRGEMGAGGGRGEGNAAGVRCAWVTGRRADPGFPQSARGRRYVTGGRKRNPRQAPDPAGGTARLPAGPRPRGTPRATGRFPRGIRPQS